MLCVGLLRGFGNSGEVPSDVDCASSEFWELRSKVSVTSRMKKAGHKYRCSNEEDDRKKKAGRAPFDMRV